MKATTWGGRPNGAYNTAAQGKRTTVRKGTK